MIIYCENPEANQTNCNVVHLSSIKGPSTDFMGISTWESTCTLREVAACECMIGFRQVWDWLRTVLIFLVCQMNVNVSILTVILEYSISRVRLSKFLINLKSS